MVSDKTLQRMNINDGVSRTCKKMVSNLTPCTCDVRKDCQISNTL